MTAHRLPYDLAKIELFDDPGDGGTIQIEGRSHVAVALVSAAAETRTLADPNAENVVLTLYFKTDGGDITLTASTAYDQASSTSVVFNDAGDFITFRSIESGSSFVWRVVGYDGVTGPTTEVAVVDVDTLQVDTLLDMQSGSNIDLKDSCEVKFGTGDDVAVKWDGTRLVGKAAANAMWDDCPSPLDPNYRSQCHEFFDDFTGERGIDTTATVGNWAAFNVGTGTTTFEDDVAGGVLLLTCQATTDNACEQLNGLSASFLLAAGKTLWYETRLKIVGDVQSEHSFGLVALGEDLTAVADVLPADGVSFSTQDATLAAALTLSKNGTDTGAVAGVHTLVSGTYVTLGFKIVGTTSCTPYVNGTAGTAATATFNDDEAMVPYFLVRNGDGTTQQKMHVDYVRVVQLR